MVSLEIIFEFIGKIRDLLLHKGSFQMFRRHYDKFSIIISREHLLVTYLWVTIIIEDFRLTAKFEYDPIKDRCLVEYFRHVKPDFQEWNYYSERNNLEKCLSELLDKVPIEKYQDLFDGVLLELI